MDQTIIAIYENGVLRPLTPLALPEHTEVEIALKIRSVNDGNNHVRARRVGPASKENISRDRFIR